MTTQTPISDAVTTKGNGATGVAIPAVTAGSPAPLPQPRPESILRRTPAPAPAQAKDGKDATQTKVKTQKAAKKTTKVKAAPVPAKVPAKVPDGTKHCPRCKKTKPLDEFPHSKKNGTLKPRFSCIPCYKAYTKEQTAKAKVKAASKKVTKVTKKKTKKPVVKAKAAKVKVKKTKRPKVKKIQRRATAPQLTGDLRDLVNSLQLVKTKSVKRVKDLQEQAKALGVEITAAEKAVAKIEKLILMAK